MKTLDMPPLRLDGTCSACVGGWQCEYRQRAGVLADKIKAAAVAEASHMAHRMVLQVIIATCQLESDEGGTATMKAERILEER
jgi:hypothetical protein